MSDDKPISEAKAIANYIKNAQGYRATSIQYVLAMALIKLTRTIQGCLPAGTVGPSTKWVAPVFVGIADYLTTYPSATRCRPDHMRDYQPRAVAQCAIMQTIEPATELMGQALERVQFKFPSREEWDAEDEA